MIGLLIAILLINILEICMIITVEYKFEKQTEETMCQVLEAVYNMDAVKEKLAEAAKEGKGYVEI